MLPLVAFAIFALLSMASLAVDAGYWRNQQRIQQSATDSAVIAAAIESNATTSNAHVVSAGQADASTNGFANAATTVVTINYPPAAPSTYATSVPDSYGKYSAVEAIITRPAPSFFSGIFGGTAPTIKTRAVAISTNANSNCVYALNQNANAQYAGITIAGGGAGIPEILPGTGTSTPQNFAIFAPSCGVITDSVLTINGGAASIADQSVGFVSSAQYNNHANFYGGQPVNAKIVQDPCASFPACNAFTQAVAVNTSTIPSTAGLCTGSGVVVCSPGVYQKSITFHGSDQITFLPGVYVLQGGIDLGGSTGATGTGVVLYNAGQNSSFTMAGSGDTNITAPTSGPFSGLVYYQNPLNTQAVTWGGHNNVINLSGVAYMPNAELKLDGNAPAVTALIANDILINGGGIAVTGPNLTDSTRRHFVLAE